LTLEILCGDVRLYGHRSRTEFRMLQRVTARLRQLAHAGRSLDAGWQAASDMWPFLLVEAEVLAEYLIVNCLRDRRQIDGDAPPRLAIVVGRPDLAIGV